MTSPTSSPTTSPSLPTMSPSPSSPALPRRRLSSRRGSISASDPYAKHAQINVNPGRKSSSTLTIVRVVPEVQGNTNASGGGGVGAFASHASRGRTISLQDPPGPGQRKSPQPRGRIGSGEGVGTPGRMSFAGGRGGGLPRQSAGANTGGRMSFAFSSFGPRHAHSNERDKSPRADRTPSPSSPRSSMSGYIAQKPRLTPDQVYELAHQATASATSAGTRVEPSWTPGTPLSSTSPSTPGLSSALNSSPGTSSTTGGVAPTQFLPLHHSVYLPFIDRPAEVKALIESNPTRKLFKLLGQTFPKGPGNLDVAKINPNLSPVLSPTTSISSMDSMFSPLPPSSSLPSDDHDIPADPTTWTFSHLLLYLTTIPRSDASNAAPDGVWALKLRRAILPRSELIWERVKGALGIPPELDFDVDPADLENEMNVAGDVFESSSESEDGEGDDEQEVKRGEGGEGEDDIKTPKTDDMEDAGMKARGYWDGWDAVMDSPVFDFERARSRSGSTGSGSGWASAGSSRSGSKRISGGGGGFGGGFGFGGLGMTSTSTSAPPVAHEAPEMESTTTITPASTLTNTSESVTTSSPTTIGNPLHSRAYAHLDVDSTAEDSHSPTPVQGSRSPSHITTDLPPNPMIVREIPTPPSGNSFAEGAPEGAAEGEGTEGESRIAPVPIPGASTDDTRSHTHQWNSSFSPSMSSYSPSFSASGVGASEVMIEPLMLSPSVSNASVSPHLTGSSNAHHSGHGLGLGHGGGGGTHHALSPLSLPASVSMSSGLLGGIAEDEDEEEGEAKGKGEKETGKVKEAEKPPQIHGLRISLPASPVIAPLSPRSPSIGRSIRSSSIGSRNSASGSPVLAYRPLSQSLSRAGSVGSVSGRDKRATWGGSRMESDGGSGMLGGGIGKDKRASWGNASVGSAGSVGGGGGGKRVSWGSAPIPSAPSAPSSNAGGLTRTGSSGSIASAGSYGYNINNAYMSDDAYASGDEADVGYDPVGDRAPGNPLFPSNFARLATGPTLVANNPSLRSPSLPPQSKYPHLHGRGNRFNRRSASGVSGSSIVSGNGVSGTSTTTNDFAVMSESASESGAVGK